MSSGDSTRDVTKRASYCGAPANDRQAPSKLSRCDLTQTYCSSAAKCGDSDTPVFGRAMRISGMTSLVLLLVAVSQSGAQDTPANIISDHIRRQGYGTSIIRELIPFELGGTAHLDFAANGLHCRLEIPADWVRRPDRSSNNSVTKAVL